MDFLNSIVLMFTTAAVICFIYSKYETKEHDKEYSDFTYRLYNLIQSNSFSTKHPLLDFKIIGYFIEKEVLAKGYFDDSKHIKNLIKIAWDIYKKTNYYKILKDDLGIKNVKKFFISEVCSITINKEIEEENQLDLISNELRSFFIKLTYIKKGLTNNEIPISATVYNLSKESLAIITNFVTATSKKGVRCLDLPIENIILEWIGEQLKDANTRNYHIVPRMTFVTSSSSKSKIRDVTICIKKDLKSIYTPLVTESINYNINKWKTNNGVAEEYGNFLKGVSVHTLISFRSKEWVNLIGSFDYEFVTTTVDLSCFID